METGHYRKYKFIRWLHNTMLANYNSVYFMPYLQPLEQSSVISPNQQIFVENGKRLLSSKTLIHLLDMHEMQNYDSIIYNASTSYADLFNHILSSNYIVFINDNYVVLDSIKIPFQQE